LRIERVSVVFESSTLNDVYAEEAAGEAEAGEAEECRLRVVVVVAASLTT
jgi:hypothetical protein